MKTRTSPNITVNLVFLTEIIKLGFSIEFAIFIYKTCLFPNYEYGDGKGTCINGSMEKMNKQ